MKTGCKLAKAQMQCKDGWFARRSDWHVGRDYKLIAVRASHASERPPGLLCPGDRLFTPFYATISIRTLSHRFHLHILVIWVSRRCETSVRHYCVGRARTRCCDRVWNPPQDWACHDSRRGTTRNRPALTSGREKLRPLHVTNACYLVVPIDNMS